MQEATNHKKGEVAFMFCANCNKKQTCGKICPKVNKYLKNNGIYSANYIRPEISKNKRKDGLGKWREIPFSALGSDESGNFATTK